LEKNKNVFEDYEKTLKAGLAFGWVVHAGVWTQVGWGW
jgi:hypothetical protein